MRNNIISKKEELHFYELFITTNGRINRSSFTFGSIIVVLSFLITNIFISYTEFRDSLASFYLFLPFAWSLFSLITKRLHDTNRSTFNIFWILIPVFGALYLVFILFISSKGKTKNKYGLRFEDIKTQYANNPKVINNTVNDITQTNPIIVSEIFDPNTIEELIEKIKNTEQAFCVGGGRFSMGGQTASPNCIFIDMRSLNKILEFSMEEKTVRVQSGINWASLQEFLEPLGMAVSIMQTYANFTVGGSLSVNAHGRYIGLGPLIMSVKEISVLLANGTVKTANPQKNKDIFYSVIGGYGGIAIILDATLIVEVNTMVQRNTKKLQLPNYLKYFKTHIQNNNSVVFHNADIYPNDYNRLLSVTWSQYSGDNSLPKYKLQTIKRVYPIYRYLFWLVSSIPGAKKVREYIIDPIFYRENIVHYRNYEAGYDVKELEPSSRARYTFLLQEYFIPMEHIEPFMKDVRSILSRYKVNMLNISIRHAKKDPGSYLAWAKSEVFAFVMYYKREITETAKEKDSIWTRELISRIIEYGGSYYLPYKIYATKDMLYKCYPRIDEFFKLKHKLDPEYKLRNNLWDTYYMDNEKIEKKQLQPTSEFHRVVENSFWHDKLYLFLQNIFRIIPEDIFFAKIKEAVNLKNCDDDIYSYLLDNIDEISPPAASFRYALPALFKQKNIITQQTLQILEGIKNINGYLEIGSNGTYYSRLKKHINIRGETYFIHENEPSNSPEDIIDRESICKRGKFCHLNNYDKINSTFIPNESLELITCYIGLHHITSNKLNDFINSIFSTLKPGGIFILRDHNCKTEEMKIFVSLIHTVFNCGIKASLQYNKNEFRHFRSIDEWVYILEDAGFISTKWRIYQDYDPSDNCLLKFVKPGGTSL